jgi:DNA sulfur modification protein DndB
MTSKPTMETQPTLTFPVIRGLQARREYYMAMWTLRMLRQISIFNEEELTPELRAQRILNKARIPEMANYVLDNPTDYVFSAITASIDGDVKFTTINNTPEAQRNGFLRIDMNSKIIVIL